MRITAAGLRLIVGLLPSLAVAASCSSGEQQGCGSDTSCGAGLACVAGQCIPVAAMSQEYAIELSPTGSSNKSEGGPAYTEIVPGAPLAGAGTVLVLDRRVRVTGLVTTGTAASPDKSLEGLRVVASVPSSIPGELDLPFEGDARATAEGLTFALFPPARAVGRPVKIWARPGSPGDQQVPSWLEQSTLTAAITLTVPGASQLLNVEGRLLDALEQPVRGYRARALQDGRVISSEGMTMADGTFRLVVRKPAATVRDGAFSLELIPVDATAPLPRLTVAVASFAQPALGVLKLPAFARPETFRFPITGAGQPVPGASLRFRTDVPGAVPGTASFQRDAQTNAQGIAEVELIPGQPDNARQYGISIIPPATSAFLARCVSAFPIVGSGGAAPRTVASMELERKVTLSGVLRDSQGQPASRVSVTATERPGAYDSCDENLAGPPRTEITDEAGRFVLPLAPGRYRIDYVPGAGSALPLFSEPDVMVDADLVRDAQLPAAQVISGTVVDADGKATGGVDVRLLLTSMDAGGIAPPLLQGRALTSSDGGFRIVVPVR